MAVRLCLQQSDTTWTELSVSLPQVSLVAFATRGIRVGLNDGADPRRTKGND